MNSLWIGLMTAVGLLFTPITQAQAEEKVGELLATFDQRPTTESANDFLQRLREEGFLDETVSFGTNAHPDSLRQEVWYWAAEYLYDQQDYQQAEDYALRAMPLCRGGEKEGDCLSLLSIINIRQGNFDEALRYAKETNKLDMKQGDPDMIASSLNTLAGIYMSMRQPREAEHYALKAIDYCQKAGNKKRLAVVYGMTSEIYHLLKNDKTALDYATRAYNIEVEAGRPDKAAVRQAQRAAALISLHREQEAMKALDEAIPQLRSDGNRHSLAIACNQMGLLLKGEGRDSLALGYLAEALDIFVGQGDMYNECYTHKALYELLRKSNPERAMQHMDRYNELRDTLYDQETGELLQKYAAEYGHEELLLQNANERKKHRWNIGMLVAAAAVAIALMALWHVRSRRRHMRMVEEQQAMIDALREQNDFLTDELREAGKGDPSLATKQRSQNFVKQLVEYIEKYLDEGDCSVERLALDMNSSQSTLRRHVQEITNRSPKALITSVQMARARRLFTENPKMNLSDVARRCGFTDSTSFSRVFKSYYGKSPREFKSRRN